MSSYIEASKSLQNLDIVKSIGYDNNNIEYYVFFGAKYLAVQPEIREVVMRDVSTVLQFVSKRKRDWSLILFNSQNQSNQPSKDLFLAAYQDLDDEQKHFFKTLVIIYKRKGFAGFMERAFSCGGSNNRHGPELTSFDSMHQFIKQEKAQDTKFTTAILGALPKENMQMYF